MAMRRGMQYDVLITVTIDQRACDLELTYIQ